MRHAEPLETSLDIRLMDLMTRVLVGVVLGSALVVGVIWFLDQPKFDIKALQVQNEAELKHVNVLELRQLVMGRLNGNFFTIKLDDVKVMLEKMPWVKKASVQRVWPYELSVNIKEYEPVAFWDNGEDGLQLMDVDGEIFKVSEHQMLELYLPMLQGPHEKGMALQMWQFYMQLAWEFNALNVRVDRLKLSDHGIWSMHLSNGTEVMIGRGNSDELRARVRDFVMTLPTALRPYGGRALIRADLRYANGYAMKVADVQTEVSVTNRQAPAR